MRSRQAGVALWLATLACGGGEGPGPAADESVGGEPASDAVADTAVAPSAEGAAEDDPQLRLSFAEPTDAQVRERLDLWATHYNAHLAAITPGGPLLDIDGAALGPTLSAADWCNAAMEGTVIVPNDEGGTDAYNFSGTGDVPQVDCRPFFGGLTEQQIEPINRSRFNRVDAEYGLGVRGWRLCPLRTIAVDRATIAYGSVVYIPAARGLEVLGPSGEPWTHDGYFYAGDTGGMIKGNHIDVFTGLEATNPFPDFVSSTANSTFEALVVDNEAVRAALAAMHTGGACG